jgi:hypothetical protein
MTLIWLGVLLVFGGVLQMAFQPIWRGRLSGGRRLRSGRDTLEPENSGSGFGIKSNWPGLVLVELGGAFLLAGAAFRALYLAGPRARAMSLGLHRTRTRRRQPSA